MLRANIGKRGTVGPQGIVEGFKGTVTQVNPKWSFVVLVLTEDHRLQRGTELLIQRGESLVGKVKVIDIRSEEGTAVAQIMTRWLRMPIQKGDRAIYQ